MKRLVKILSVSLAGLLCALAAQAQEVRVSSFGTIGYVRSSQEYRYQRFIDSDGTLVRDSRFGVQLDAGLTPEWSATVQARLAPSARSDKEWHVDLPWAFVSWRPDNEWLVRLGKTRVPFLLYSESLDVGTTYPFARLPIEAYSLSPTSDFYGLSVTKSWLGNALDVDLEGFAGWGRSYWRVYLRDAPLLTSGTAGPWFEGFEGPLASAVLTVHQDENRYRLSLVGWESRLDTVRFATNYPFVPLAPGVGYYQVLNEMPGPGVSFRDRTQVYALALGAEQSLPAGFRFVGEAMWRGGDKINIGAGTAAFGGYAALLKRIGTWTPYLYGARMRSTEHARTLYARLDGVRVPGLVPGAAQLNTLQRWAADSATVVDQRTWALGATCDIAPGQMLKMEWQRTHTGLTSAFIDAPLGTTSGGQDIDVFSLSYNFAF